MEWERAGCPPHGERPGEGDILASDSSGYQVQRYEAYTPSIELKGDIEALALWSGQGVGLVDKIQPAATIVEELITNAKDSIEKVSAMLSS